jgi:hypothetical protein
MTFEDATRDAARAAHDACSRAMRKYRDRRVWDEDDITGVLVGQLDATLDGQIGGLDWDCSILRHRAGVAAEEKEYGADLLIHVKFETNTEKFSKGVLVQSKKMEPRTNMWGREHAELIDQCNRMLAITPAAFVFDYAQGSMRCGSASRIRGSARVDLYHICGWTPYRFFLEFFRCPIGDPRITSGRVPDLPDDRLAPLELKISAAGDLTESTETSLTRF